MAGSTFLFPARVDEAERVIVTSSEKDPEVAGRDLDDLAREMGATRREAAERLVPAGAVYFQMAEEDMRRILAYPPTMIGSDGLVQDRHPHPRAWGTFPRVLGRYARDEGLLTLEQAVHKMTGLTAARFGSRDRGVLRAGAFADLTLFDPAEVLDLADFEHPTRPAAGIAGVWVNGRRVWEGGAPTGARPGRPLRRAA